MITKESVNQRFINLVTYVINSNLAKNKTEIADKLGVKGPKFSEILNGRVNVGVEMLVNFCELYNINYEYVLTGRGSIYVNDISAEGATIVSEPGFVYEVPNSDAALLYDEDEIEEFTNKSGNKFSIYPDGTIKIQVPLMTEPAYAGYLDLYNDGDANFLQELPTTTFKVDKIGKGNYMAFTIKNNSMWNGGGYDTPGGAEILGREVNRHLWEDGFHKTDYGFILMTTKGIFHKDIKSYDKSTGNVTLASRNPEVLDFEISINDINKVFNVIKRAF